MGPFRRLIFGEQFLQFHFERRKGTGKQHVKLMFAGARLGHHALGQLDLARAIALHVHARMFFLEGLASECLYLQARLTSRG